MLTTGEVVDRRHHPIRVAVHIDRTSVGEHGGVGRIDGKQFQPIRDRLTHGRKDLVDKVGHGENSWAGIDSVSIDVESAGASTRPSLAFNDRDGAAAARQVQRRGQPR
ncbi:hypothetical protein MSHO_58250 [Mycobacterium shottsii]|uniref:Uncharacterized protein n=1 Tax=Mycobacterium shottsii TaxID=133549 RepID=A0A7I7LLJ9_9MYCO|nr:hypothetical protein MSHO_58250 [Mycobacterium shottsii]